MQPDRIRERLGTLNFYVLADVLQRRCFRCELEEEEQVMEIAAFLDEKMEGADLVESLKKIKEKRAWNAERVATEIEEGMTIQNTRQRLTGYAARFRNRLKHMGFRYVTRAFPWGRASPSCKVYLDPTLLSTRMLVATNYEGGRLREFREALSTLQTLHHVKIEDIGYQYELWRGHGKRESDAALTWAVTFE